MSGGEDVWFPLLQACLSVFQVFKDRVGGVTVRVTFWRGWVSVWTVFYYYYYGPWDLKSL